MADIVVSHWRLLKDKIFEYVVEYGLINDSQHGFISKKSCLTNLLHFFEIVTDYVDNGCPVIIIIHILVKRRKA